MFFNALLFLMFVFFLFLFFPSFRYCIRFKDAAPNGSYCYEYLKNYYVIKGKKDPRNKEKVFKGISSLLSERWMSDKYLNKKLKDSIEFYLTSMLIILKSHINRYDVFAFLDDYIYDNRFQQVLIVLKVIF